MQCFICEAPAELVGVGSDNRTVDCPNCKIYWISGSAIGMLSSRSLAVRLTVLEKARAAAEAGNTPKISSMMI